MLRAVSYYVCGLRGEAYKPFQRIGGFAFGTGFEQFSDCDERQYHSRRFKIELVHIHHNGICILVKLCIGHHKQGIYAPYK